MRRCLALPGLGLVLALGLVGAGSGCLKRDPHGVSALLFTLSKSSGDQRGILWLEKTQRWSFLPQDHRIPQQEGTLPLEVVVELESIHATPERMALLKPCRSGPQEPCAQAGGMQIGDHAAVGFCYLKSTVAQRCGPDALATYERLEQIYQTYAPRSPNPAPGETGTGATQPGSTTAPQPNPTQTGSTTAPQPNPTSG